MTWLHRVRRNIVEVLIRYLVEPLERGAPDAAIDTQSLAAVLHPGDVLLSVSNTRIAALVKRVTRSPWSHVSLYVGPLEDGPDPRCVVEADIAAGVRSIRLSELNALQVRVLRPLGLCDADRCRLATWVTGRIGCQYDLAYAWHLGRHLLQQPLRIRLRSMPAVTEGARRFICCSLLAHGFALVGCPISTGTARANGTHALTDRRHLTPGDFEHAPVFKVIEPANHAAQWSDCSPVPHT